jgi:hypothetical protein
LADGRSEQGRFIRHLEAELVAHVGGQPSITQRLLIDRIVRLRLQLDAFDVKLTSGEVWTPHDLRTFSGINNAFKNSLKELGFKAATVAKPADPVADIAARIAVRRGAAA